MKMNPHIIAQQLLEKYGSKSVIKQHFEELAAFYGKDFFATILSHVEALCETNREQHVFGPDSPEKKEMYNRLNILKMQFKMNTRYAFVVAEKQNGVKWGRVKDQNGKEHPIDMSPRFEVGDRISCNVYGYYAKVKGPGNVVVNLKLDNPRRIPESASLVEYVPGLKPHYIKSPEKWYAEVEGLGKHICGKPFTCSCCGKDFPARKGYRIDFKEIYFCLDCKREIFQPSGRGWAGRIISTPMGNKR